MKLDTAYLDKIFVEQSVIEINGKKENIVAYHRSLTTQGIDVTYTLSSGSTITILGSDIKEELPVRDVPPFFYYEWQRPCAFNFTEEDKILDGYYWLDMSGCARQLVMIENNYMYRLGNNTLVRRRGQWLDCFTHEIIDTIQSYTGPIENLKTAVAESDDSIFKKVESGYYRAIIEDHNPQLVQIRNDNMYLHGVGGCYTYHKGEWVDFVRDIKLKVKELTGPLQV